MNDIWSNKNEVLELVKQNGYCLRNASSSLKDDKEVVFAAVNSNGPALVYASDRLKNNEEIVLCAITNNINAGKYIGQTLKQDISFARKVVKVNANAIIYFAPNIAIDKNVLLIVTDDPCFDHNLFPKSASENKEIMLYLIDYKIYNKYFVSDKLKNDPDILRLISFKELTKKNQTLEILINERNILNAKLNALNSLIYIKSIQESIKSKNK